jgi:dihydropteroate synthase
MELRNGRFLDFSRKPLVMGIVNCTPDSFFAGSRAPVLSEALEQAKRFIDAGADILDIGESPRAPVLPNVDGETERERVIPVVEGIRGFSDVPISVDTRKALVMRQALDAGADILNDISALADDEDLSALSAESGCPVILMHMRGNPLTMQEAPFYEDTLSEVMGSFPPGLRRRSKQG